jgi:putative endonuclease
VKKKTEQTGHNKGMLAETVAALFLRMKGWRIMERRYRTHVGEIDIVAKRYGVVAFIEVKFRRKTEDAAEAIDRINQSRVRRAAELYLMKHTEYTTFETRFDVVIMAPNTLPEHIENAF